AAHRARLPGAGRPWLNGLRDAAIEAFARIGFPNRRMEEWRYVDLRALGETAWRPADAGTVAAGDLPAPLLPDGVRVVLVDGRFRPDLSQGLAGTEGLTVLSLADAIAAGDPLAEQA